MNLSVQNCNFAKGSGIFCSISLPIGPTDSGFVISIIFIFC